MATLEIALNGERLRFEGPLTIAELIERLDLGDRRVAVEQNREIVPRSAHAETPVENGDVVEIVHFVGGG